MTYLDIYQGIAKCDNCDDELSTDYDEHSEFEDDDFVARHYCKECMED